MFFSDDTLTKTKGNGRSNAGTFSTNPRCSSSVVAPGTVGTQTDAAIAAVTFINASALPPLPARPAAPRHRRGTFADDLVGLSAAAVAVTDAVVASSIAGVSAETVTLTATSVGFAVRDVRATAAFTVTGNASALPPLVALHYDENDAVRTGTSECMEAHSVERPSDTPAASDTMRTGG